MSAQVPVVSLIFIGIALMFLILVARDYLKAERTLTVRMKIWLRMALIFSAAAIGVYALQHMLR